MFSFYIMSNATEVILFALIGKEYELSDVISDWIFWHDSKAICQQLKCSFNKLRTGFDVK